MNSEAGIQSFTQLNAWKNGHQLVLEIYKITESFPQTEQFILAQQLKRAAISFTSNIAEGFSRRSYKDKAHFYHISLGSLTEIQNQLIIAKDLGYISKSSFDSIANKSISLSKITNGLIKKSYEIHNS